MQPFDLPFIVGKDQAGSTPLSRYLPPVPSDIASEWLAARFSERSWILDPFGAQPQLAIEMARAGFRVLVAANNPIAAFMLETMASAPRAEDLRAALSDLASARKGDERLELHIQSLYTTECVVCKQSIQAKAFIWQRDALVPTSCLVDCPFCGDNGERPVSPANLERLASLGKGTLPRARALERITTLDDPVRTHVEQALNCYLPRPLYALITLINRLEGLALPAVRHRLATALLLIACDEANTLWPYPTTRSRPRQLVIPSTFRENNLWQVLESAIVQWQSTSPAVPLTIWPDLPPERGGICLFKGRLRDLAADVKQMNISAALTALPRPNQAFWTLSAVWAGWLWGREAVAPLKNSLSRQRYDWSWHTSALESTLTSLKPLLKNDAQLFGLVAEAEPSFLLAAMLAAENAGFELQGMALRADQAFVQGLWQAQPQPNLSEKKTDPDSLLKTGIRTHLEIRAEPSPYLPVYALAANTMILNWPAHTVPEGPSPALSIFSQIHTSVQKAITDTTFLTRFGGTIQSPEHGLWWLADTPPKQISLSDEVEKEIVRLLQRSPGCTYMAVDQAMCYKFPGLLTPSSGLLQACLDSYGEQRPPESDSWFLRQGETPSIRRHDLASIKDLLQNLGRQLEYQVEGENPITWSDHRETISYAFYWLASGIISQFILANPYPPGKSIIVLPGSRANLVSYKLRHNPWLNEAVAKGWRFLKFRHLRQLASSLLPSRAIWDEQLNGDPLDYKASQIEIDAG